MKVIVENVEFEIDDDAEEIYDMLMEEKYYTPCVVNGYLARKSKKDGSIDFFHRNYYVIKNPEYIGNLIHKYGHVHHIDLNKCNNKLLNLVMCTREEHEEYHRLLKIDEEAAGEYFAYVIMA